MSTPIENLVNLLKFNNNMLDNEDIQVQNISNLVQLLEYINTNGGGANQNELVNTIITTLKFKPSILNAFLSIRKQVLISINNDIGNYNNDNNKETFINDKLNSTINTYNNSINTYYTALNIKNNNIIVFIDSIKKYIVDQIYVILTILTYINANNSISIDSLINNADEKEFSKFYNNLQITNNILIFNIIDYTYIAYATINNKINTYSHYFKYIPYLSTSYYIKLNDNNYIKTSLQNMLNK